MKYINEFIQLKNNKFSSETFVCEREVVNDFLNFLQGKGNEFYGIRVIYRK